MVEKLSNALLPIDRHWAIDDGYGETALEILDGIDYASHLAAYRADAEKDEGPTRPAAARRGRGSRDGDSEEKPYDMVGSVAVIGIDGPMTKKMTSASYMFGGTSTIQVRKLVRQAANDSDVSAIVLLIESPGGQVSGTAELADDVTRARAKKPVLAFVDDLCCSAAYWVAAQCDEIYANRNTACVGSIGVVAIATDSSRMYENAGVVRHIISTGKYKGAGATGTPISADLLAEWQREVDYIGQQFVQAVAVGRGMETEAVAKLADGRVWNAEEAVALGLIDGITDADSLFGALDDTGGGGYTSLFSSLSSLSSHLSHLDPDSREDPVSTDHEAHLASAGKASSMSFNFKDKLKSRLRSRGVSADEAAQIVDMAADLVQEQASASASASASGEEPTPSSGPAPVVAQDFSQSAEFKSMEKQIAELREANTRKDAEAFYSAALHAGKIVPAEKGAFMAAYVQAAADDAERPVSLTFGQAAGSGSGSRVDALKATVENRISSGLLGERMPDGNLYALDTQASTGSVAAESYKEGRALAESLNAKSNGNGNGANGKGN